MHWGGVYMEISNFENKFLSSMAFLSGCSPIALIHFVKVVGIPYYEFANDITFDVVRIFSVCFLGITIFCSILFRVLIDKKFSVATTHVKILHLQRKDLFSSGALSCYVFPFLSLIGDDIQSTISLAILILLFLKVFSNNIMFLYTPMFDIWGYKILEGSIKYSSHGQDFERKCNLIVKSDENLYFETDNDAVMEKLNETTFCVKPTL